MTNRVQHVDATAEHHRGRAVPGQGTAMRRAVDAERTARYDLNAARRQVATERMSAVHPGLRRRTGSDDGNRRTVEQRRSAQVDRSVPSKRLKALGQPLRSQHEGAHKGEAISYPSPVRQVQAM